MSQLTVRDLAFDLAQATFAFPRWAAMPLAFIVGALAAPVVWAHAVALLVALILAGLLGAVIAIRQQAATAGWLASLLTLGLLVAGIGHWRHHDEWALVGNLTAGLITLSGALLVAKRYGLPQGSSKKTLQVMSEVDQANDNAAGRLDLMRHASPAALRRQAVVLRPSLAGQPRRKINPAEVGAHVLTMGLGWLPGEAAWVDCESVTGIVATSRQGKSALLSSILLHVPGAAVCTSTRLDMAEWTHAKRTEDGKGVAFWNATDQLDVPSTWAGGPHHGKPVRWPVLAGCDDFATADRRATLMIPGNGDRESARWDNSARDLFGVMLNAAALGGYSMFDVERWVADEMNGDGECLALDEITDALAKGKGVARSRITAIRQHYTTGGATRTSVTFTLRTQALGWLRNDLAAGLAACRINEGTLDLEEIVRKGWTLHILGRDEGVGPLNACLVGELAHIARRVAGRMPEQRLDPPLALLLDEAAVACPVPLHDWAADMGGSGIWIFYSVQGLSQLDDRYGAAKGRVIRRLTNNRIELPGGNDGEEFDEVAKMSGETRRMVYGAKVDHALEDSRWEETVSASRLRTAPKFTGFLYRSNMRVAVGRIPRVWLDPSKPAKTPLGREAQELAAANELVAAEARGELTVDGDTGAQVVTRKGLPAQRNAKDEAARD